MIAELKNVVPELFDTGLTGVRLGVKTVDHPPRILMLYGSVRERSYSRLATEEAARLLTAMGADVRIFNPSGLPLPDDAADTHPRVMELREMVRWSEGMVWCSPERHGAMTGIMKAQIDWIPLSEGAVRPSQGKTLAVMQVCGGSQSFNAVNQMRILGRWMRMITIPNQSSVAKAWQEFDEERTGDREQAADLLQEVFLRARACADRFCEMENPRAWLYRTARNLLTDEYRAARDVVVLEDEIPLPDAFHEAV
ncbi:arsenical resistance protein ArsH, partial [Klebsiella pneumoniae]|uniref:arsenical resistance protein ArsH n=15 Tax=Enterobacteriaceae TaxID=543 RepID=UPI0009B95BCE